MGDPVSAYTPTTLGFAILGLLDEKPRTGYAVRRVFETTPMAHYSSSPGSIYPALRRLREEGLVRVKEGVRTGQIQSLTRAGRTALRRWLHEPVAPTEVPWREAELLLRFAFMGAVEDSVRESFLDVFAAGAEGQAEALEAFREERREAFSAHAWHALGHGIARARADAAWAREAAKALK